MFANDSQGNSGSRVPHFVADPKIAQLRGDVDKVSDLMRHNLASAMDRETALSELRDKSDRLQDGAEVFRNNAVATKRKMWYENVKMWIIIAAIVIVLIIVITLIAVDHESKLIKAHEMSTPVHDQMPQSNNQTQSSERLQTQGTSKRLLQTHAQVSDVVQIMRMNVEKVLERDAKLSQLDDRADALQHGAAQFEMQAGKLKRKYWWKNCKALTALIIIVAIILIVLIGKNGPL
ncbi:hypothetical protein ACOME3_002833 [Neoechinorhynchus agilis]